MLPRVHAVFRRQISSANTLQVMSPTMLPLSASPASGFRLASRGSRASRSGFSLVEVTLAIGIVAFAFVALFALLPQGMSQFRRTMETTLSTQIAQRVITDAQQTDFAKLVDDAGGEAKDGLTFRAPVRGDARLRFFDEDGNEVKVTDGQARDPASLDAEQRLRITYWVNTRIMPKAPLPTGDGGTEVRYSKDIALVTVQVAVNPSGKPIEFSPEDAGDEKQPGRNLFKAPPWMSVSTYSSLIARGL